MNAFSDFPIFGTGGSASSGSCGLSAVKLMIYLIGEIIKAELRLRKGIILGMIFEESFGSSWFPIGLLGRFRLAHLQNLRRSYLATRKIAMSDGTPNHHLAGQPPALAGAPARCGPEHGLREGTGAGGEGSRDTRPSNATRYAELASLLTERVALVELALSGQETFAAAPLDEHLSLDLHRRIAGELVPEWAGRGRDIVVTVGRLDSPQQFQVPVLMRNYALDLPRVELAPQTESGRAEYFTALEAADRRDLQPLVDIWRDRLAHAETPEA